MDELSDDSPRWCDDEFGWGPFVEGTNTLTSCFCSTFFELPSPIILAIFGIPGLIKLSREPFVNPASSWSFSLKLGLSALALFCCMLLAMFGQPPSAANTWAQSLAAAGWLLSILMLVAGYLRAQPQLLQLRLWWVAQFLADLIVFANHSTLRPSDLAHIVRGISLLCAALLVCLSYYLYDVPKYQEIVAPVSVSSSSFRSPSQGPSNQTSSTPLLAPRLRSGVNSSPLLASSSAMNIGNTDRRYGLASQLSQMTLYGADTSAFKGAISAWDEAVTSSYKAQSQMATSLNDTENGENGNGNGHGRNLTENT